MMTPKLLLNHKKNERCRSCFFYVALRKDWPCELDVCPNRKGACSEYRQFKSVIINDKRYLTSATI